MFTLISSRCRFFYKKTTYITQVKLKLHIHVWTFDCHTKLFCWTRYISSCFMSFFSYHLLLIELTLSCTLCLFLCRLNLKLFDHFLAWYCFATTCYSCNKFRMCSTSISRWLRNKLCNITQVIKLGTMTMLIFIFPCNSQKVFLRIPNAFFTTNLLLLCLMLYKLSRVICSPSLCYLPQ
jgi:hypothetical protein